MEQTQEQQSNAAVGFGQEELLNAIGQSSDHLHLAAERSLAGEQAANGATSVSAGISESVRWDPTSSFSKCIRKMFSTGCGPGRELG